MLDGHDRKDKLLEAGLTLASELSLPIVLQRIVDLAAEVTDARYGALGVIGEGNTLVEFVTTGIGVRQRKAIGSLPSGRGVLGLLIHEPSPVRIRNIAEHPQSVGFPPHHPPMRSFLGAPVKAMGRVFGNIYLADKRGADEFGQEDQEALVVLATQAGIAIANASLYEELRSRERWLDALRDITTKVLASRMEGSILESIAEHARDLAGADSARILVRGSVRGRLVIAAAAGARAGQVRGQTVPEEGSIAGAVMRTAVSQLFEDVSTETTAYKPIVALGRNGPAIYVPLRVSTGAAGTLVVANLKGGRKFTQATRALVESLADAASVAIEYDRAQAELRKFGLMEERERIAKELHDGIIQSLFAVGMGLQGTALMAGNTEIATRLEDAVGALDRVIRDLRNYIFGLRPGILADRQLDHALRDLGEQMQTRSREDVEVQVDAALAARLSGRSADIVQLTREALSNVARHAHAKHVAVHLLRNGTRAILTVTDDGIGFKPNENSVGDGMRNMRERAQNLGGTLEVNSDSARGTTVRVTFPA